MLSPDVIVWNRQTYSTLDFLGDLGGLFDALKLIGEAVIAPFSEFALKVTMMISLFRPKGSFHIPVEDHTDDQRKKSFDEGRGKSIDANLH